MPRDPDKAGQALERKLAKREQHQPAHPAGRHSVPGWIQRASEWPVLEVLLARKWDEPMGLAGILVARYSPQAQVAAASFLVDLACLGVKSSAVRLFKTQREYAEDMRSTITRRQPMMSADINLVAKIIETGVEYAQSLGFSPDPTYYQARVLLGTANPELSNVPVSVGGSDGKPFFIAGPYDDVAQVMNRLTRAVGPDGFHYMAPLGSGGTLILDDVDLDERL